MILKLMVAQFYSEQAPRLERELAIVNSMVSDVTADRRQIATAAQTASELADQIARHMANFHFESADALQLMKRISGAAEEISYQGERSAEQAAMVLNSLVIAYCEKAKPPAATQAEMKAAVSALFGQIESPSSYAPSSFAAKMHAFHGVLR
jgi:hypothetical protein